MAGMTSILARSQRSENGQGILESKDREPQVAFGTKIRTFQSQSTRELWRPGGKQLRCQRAEEKEEAS